MITTNGRVGTGKEIFPIQKLPEDNTDNVGTANENARECFADLGRSAEGVT